MKRFFAVFVLIVTLVGCKSQDSGPLATKATVTKVADIPYAPDMVRMAYAPNTVYVTIPNRIAIYQVDLSTGGVSVFQGGFGGTNLVAIAVNNDQICFGETIAGAFYSYRGQRLSVTNKSKGTQEGLYSLKAAPGSPLTYVAATGANRLVKIVTTPPSDPASAVLTISTSSVNRQLESVPNQANAQLATNSKSMFVFCNHALWKLQPDNTLTVVAGAAGQSGYVDGAGSAARFQDGGNVQGNAIAVDEGDNVYVADYGSGCIRRVDASGKVMTVAGNKQYYNPIGVTKEGNSNNTAFNFTSGDIVLAPDGTLYVLAIAGGSVTSSSRFALYKVVFN